MYFDPCRKTTLLNYKCFGEQMFFLNLQFHKLNGNGKALPTLLTTRLLYVIHLSSLTQTVFQQLHNTFSKQ